MKKFDWILIAAVLALALLVWGGWAIIHPSGGLHSSDGEMYAVAELDGREVARLPLSEDGEHTLICGDGEYNRIVVKDGTVFISEASCPDKICVHTGKVNREGDSIVCLPHRLVVRVEKAAKE